jgi:hypothetical protein
MLAKHALYSLSHTSSPFYSGYFGDAVSSTVYWEWSSDVILPISASKKLGFQV